jgi:hypothetical protein
VAVRLDYPVDSEIGIGLFSNGIHPDTGSLLSFEAGDGANFGTGATDCSGTPTVFDDEAPTPITAGSRAVCRLISAP